MEMACSTSLSKAGLCWPSVSGSGVVVPSRKQTVRHSSTLFKSTATLCSDSASINAEDVLSVSLALQLQFRTRNRRRGQCIYGGEGASCCFRMRCHKSPSGSGEGGVSVGLPRYPRHGVQCQAGSVDVSNEEKNEPSASPETDGEPIQLDSRRGLEERFAVLYSGVHECSSCGYTYDPTAGDKSYPIPPGMEFRSLPEDWLCPTCGAARSYFRSKSIEVAGFAQNQSYGLGGNSLTSGQKSLLIYGTLVFFFALFLSGYFLQ